MDLYAYKHKIYLKKIALSFLSEIPRKNFCNLKFVEIFLYILLDKDI